MKTTVLDEPPQTELQDNTKWVEMLQEMPDIRPEKIKEALRASPSSKELAEKILVSNT